MKLILKTVLLLFTGLLTINCGENKTKAGDESSGNISSIPEKNMCELLTKETMSTITGISFNEEMVTLHQTDKSAGKYVSQCGYYSDAGDVGVLVRRFGNTSFPKEKEALIGSGKTGDPELDAMNEKAAQTSKAVTGLGDAAYFYNLGGIYNLIVVFDDHYQAHISFLGKGFAFDDKTLETSKKIAIEVIKIFK